MKQLIQKKLRQLEQEKDIRILYACESGSRAWGFPSPDSDYDVRIVYIYPKKSYLSIRNPSDQFNLPIDENLIDISAWEVRKALHLFSQSNVSMYEWMQSPIVYFTDDYFLEMVRKLAKNYFSSKAAIHHYLGLTQKTFNTALQEERINLKKYFYALRPILAATWIVEEKTIPPLNFYHLLPLVENKEPLVYKTICDLLQQKETALETHKITPVTVLHDYITQQINLCKQYASGLEKPQKELKPLDKLFRKLLKSNI